MSTQFYNPKIDYITSKRMTKRILSHNEDEYYYRDIFNGRETSIKDSLSLFIHKMKKVIDYIKMTSTNLSIESIYEILSILDINKDDVKEEVLKKEIIDEYYNSDNKNNPFISIDSFIRIIKDNIFSDKDNNLIMSVIIHNFINIRNNISPIIFSFDILDLIYERIINNNIKEAKDLIYKEYSLTSIYNLKHDDYSIEYIKSILKSFYDKYKDIYHIDEIYIYGSYASNRYNPYSDLDLYMIVESIDTIDNDRLRIISILKDMIYINIDLSLDTIDNKYISLNKHQKGNLMMVEV